MVYVPKATVVEFMKKVSKMSLFSHIDFLNYSLLILFAKVEDESNKRIKKYADYAREMKDKFTDYEAQSEKYYSEMLEKFKTQARTVVTKKQKELDELKANKKEHEERIVRLKERIEEKKIKNFWSDEEEESEDEPVEIKREVSMEDYEYAKA